MRFLCFLFLVALAGVVGVFAYQNQEEITIKFWDSTYTTTVPLLAGALYLLGMFSGWTIIGMVRRSLNRVVETDQGAYARH